MLERGCVGFRLWTQPNAALVIFFGGYDTHTDRQKSIAFFSLLYLRASTIHIQTDRRVLLLTPRFFISASLLIERLVA